MFGDRVVWTQRGAQNYGSQVRGTVVRVTKKRVTIEIRTEGSTATVSRAVPFDGLERASEAP